jgi:DNA-binding response OmpR family regulator
MAEKKDKKKILVCDDEEAIRLLLNEALGDFWEVTTAADGRESLTLATTGRFDLMIVDIKMPLLNGVDLINRLKERGIGMPIIVCSAFRHLGDDFLKPSSGVAGFFPKPIDLKELKAKIFELIGV